MHYPNIVWFLIDSIRTYPTDQDLRGKLPIMERFGQESVEFKTCVTTAPSTIMSVTAMMTGLPAYFLARNYDDFRFDNRFYPSLVRTLKQYGYTSYAFLRGFDTRERLSTLLDPVPRRYWAPHLRHRFKWTNEDLNLVLQRVLQAGIPRPAFLFFHYNPQTGSERGTLIDPAVSDRVETAWNKLKQAGFRADNSIYIMCSDHGFPDPSTGMTTEWEIQHRLAHDLVLTDDNILVPLHIQYPGCTPKRITTPVSTMDIFPTLLDLAGIPDIDELKSAIDGISLVPLMETDDESTYPRRFFRCDSRLMLQTGRSTAIRTRDFKYIRFHDEYRVLTAGQWSPMSEVLIDLNQDPSEEKNSLLAESTMPDTLRALNACRAEFERTEAKAVEFQVNYFLARHKETVLAKSNSHSSGQALRLLLIFEPDTAAYAEIGLRAIAKAYPKAEVDVLMDHGTLPDIHHTTTRTFAYAQQENGQLRTSLESNDSSSVYDLSILFVQDPSSAIAAALLDIAKTFEARRQFVLDCNFNVHRARRYWYYRFRALVERLPYILEEPALLLLQVRAGIQLLARHVLSRFGLWYRWEQSDDEDQNDA